MEKLSMSVPEDSRQVKLEFSTALNEKETEKTEVKAEDEDVKLPLWLDGVSEEYALAREYAESALEFLIKLDEGNKYELVETGPHNAAEIPGGPIIHLNFKGKARDRPGAEVETFFAQIRIYPALKVDCCVSLGPSPWLPHWSEADNRGCNFCLGLVHHPAVRCYKLIKGVNLDEVSWLYGDIHQPDN